MMVMAEALGGIAPVFLLIALGYYLRKSGFLPPDFWRPIEKFSVYVLYPGFLIPAIWHADFSGAAAGILSLSILGATLIGVGLGLALKPVLHLPDPTYSSVFQGLVRFNSFVFIPVAAAIFGEKALSLAAVAISVLIPTTNLMAITALARWGEPPDGLSLDRSARGILKALLRNPIFIACLIGLGLNFLNVPSLGIVDETLKSLGQAAIPTGLILAGAGLSFSYIITRPLMVGAVSVFKVIVLPLLAWGLSRLMGADALTQGLALAIGAAPSAAAGYVLARHMGGDAPFMAGVIALTTVLSAFILPVLLWLFHLA